MSTILDALRRLEEDKRRSRQVHDPLQVALEPVPSPGKKPSRLPRAVMVGAGIVILSVAAVGMYWATSRKAQTVQTEKPGSDARVARIQPSDLAPAPSPPPNTQTEIQAAKRVGVGPSPGPSEASLEKPSERALLAPRDKETVTPFSVPSPDQAVAPDQEEPSWESDLAVPDEVDSDLVEPDLEEIGQEEILPRGPVGGDESQPEPRRATALEEKGIRISAVVWDPEPSKRFAVVNLRTIHEGDEVGGRRVAEIREDGVVFLQGGQRYKVLLGRR